MKFGEFVPHLEELADENPEDVPAALLTQPILEPPLSWVRDAFWLLNGGRKIVVGMAGPMVQALDLSDIFAMADEFAFDRLYFLRVIRPSDDLYREFVTARAK